MKCRFFQFAFGIGLGTVISLSACTRISFPIPLKQQESDLPTKTADSLIQQLPTVEGITLDHVQYIRAETIPNPRLERAILKQLDGYRHCSNQDSTQGVRYFYNQADLNDDNEPETIVYLVGSFSCGTGGCTALIFDSSQSNYQLIARLTLVNNPIIVSNQKTKGWHDLILYITGGGIESSYQVLRFDGYTYPSNPSIQPALPSGTVIQGKALIANQISFDPNADVLQSEDCELKSLDLMRTEGFGDLRIDTSATKILQILGEPESKDRNTLSEADGLYHQYWYYPVQGITLEMVSTAAGERQRVASIELAFPSQLETNRGIGIGDSHDAVVAAYHNEEDRENSSSQERFVAGTIYGGIVFSFQNGQVSSIYLGAAAE